MHDCIMFLQFQYTGVYRGLQKMSVGHCNVLLIIIFIYSSQPMKPSRPPLIKQDNDKVHAGKGWCKILNSAIHTIITSRDTHLSW